MGGKKPSSQHVGKVLTSPDKPNNTYSNDNRGHNRGNGIRVLCRDVYSGPIHKRKPRRYRRYPIEKLR